MLKQLYLWMKMTHLLGVFSYENRYHRHWCRYCGAACAYELARQGLNVQVLDARIGGATVRAWGIWSLWMTWKPN